MQRSKALAPGRPSISDKIKVKTRTIGADNDEWKVIKELTAERNFKSPMDLFRQLLRMELTILQRPLNRIRLPKSKKRHETAH